jgi:hypothetical protein
MRMKVRFTPKKTGSDEFSLAIYAPKQRASPDGDWTCGEKWKTVAILPSLTGWCHVFLFSSGCRLVFLNRWDVGLIESGCAT